MTRLALIAAAGIALAACGSSHRSSSAPTPPHHQRQYPVVVNSPLVQPIRRPGVKQGVPVLKLPAFVSPTRLGIYTTGSGSCPHVPDKLTVLGPHTIRVHLSLGTYRGGKFEPGATGACFLNLTATPMLLAIDPKQIDVHRPLTILGLSSRGVTVAPLTS
jgi:hypothetical protein